MAAAAYKVSLNVVNKSGQRRSFYLTGSDVNAAALAFPSGGTEMVLSSEPCAIVDMIYSAAGTDTTNTTVYIGGIDSGTRIVHSTNLGTVIQRQIASNPISLPAGAMVKFIQNT